MGLPDLPVAVAKHPVAARPRKWPDQTIVSSMGDLFFQPIDPCLLRLGHYRSCDVSVADLGTIKPQT